MTERRWPLVLAALVAALVVAGGAFAIGRSTAPESAAPTSPAGRSALTQTVAGVTIGVSRSRAGALAASDNYVAAATRDVVQDPIAATSSWCAGSYAPSYQQTALPEAKETRQRSAAARCALRRRVARPSRSSAPVASTATTAREASDHFVGRRLSPGAPTSDTRPSVDLVETTLRWDGQRWLVTKLAGASRPAPTPRVVGYDTAESRTSAAFDRELRGMSAPVYGGE